MRHVDFPDNMIAPLDAVKKAFGSTRNLTSQEEADLQAAFDSYDRASGRGDAISPSVNFAGGLGTDFRNAYSQTYEKRRLATLREQIKALVGNRCPRCGGSRPGTLDHHLPKSDYPEFAVYPKNLLACCQECNGKKGQCVGARLW